MWTPVDVLLRRVILLALLLSSGCVSLAKPFPEKHYFALEAVRQGERGEPVSRTILQVRRFRISPRFEGKELVYRTSDTRYEADFYNEWFTSPAAMLTQQVHDWLTQAGVFQHVVDSSSYLEATHALEGAVTALYGDYRQKGAPKAVLDMQVVVIDDGPTRTDIVFRRDYHQMVDLAETSPDALTRGWNDGLRQILSRLEKDLRQSGLKAGAPKSTSNQ